MFVFGNRTAFLFALGQEHQRLPLTPCPVSRAVPDYVPHAPAAATVPIRTAMQRTPPGGGSVDTGVHGHTSVEMHCNVRWGLSKVSQRHIEGPSLK